MIPVISSTATRLCAEPELQYHIMAATVELNLCQSGRPLAALKRSAMAECEGFSSVALVELSDASSPKEFGVFTQTIKARQLLWIGERCVRG